MDAISALHHRVSVNLLTEPGPTTEQLETIIQAGLRACDHRNLRPWRYLMIEGAAREAFGKLMADVMETKNQTPLDSELRAKLEKKPFRAPNILVVVATVKEDPKVPPIEQIMSAAASAQMMVTAAHALGVGAMWRSGSMMFQSKMKHGLGLAPTDEIIGFIYLGTPVAVKPLPELKPSDFLTYWSPNKDQAP